MTQPPPVLKTAGANVFVETDHNHCVLVLLGHI